MSLICFNNQLINQSELSFSAVNRMRYGDCVFETILWKDGIIPLWKYHMARLQSSCAYLEIDFPHANLQQEFSHLIKANNLIGNIRIRLTVGRSEGDLYTPTSTKSFSMIECSQLPTSLDKKINRLGVYEENRKATGKLANLKSGNALLSVMAKKYAAANKLDEVLLLNEQDEIVEASSSNVFFVKGNQLITPPLSSGCVNGTMRSFIIDNESVSEQKVYRSEIENFDAIFLTNGIYGKQEVVEIVA